MLEIWSSNGTAHPFRFYSCNTKGTLTVIRFCLKISKCSATKLSSVVADSILCHLDNSVEANEIGYLSTISAKTTVLQVHIPYLSPLENTNIPDFNSSAVSSFCFFATNRHNKKFSCC